MNGPNSSRCLLGFWATKHTAFNAKRTTVLLFSLFPLRTVVWARDNNITPMTERWGPTSQTIVLLLCCESKSEELLLVINWLSRRLFKGKSCIRLQNDIQNIKLALKTKLWKMNYYFLKRIHELLWLHLDKEKDCLWRLFLFNHWPCEWYEWRTSQ